MTASAEQIEAAALWRTLLGVPAGREAPSSAWPGRARWIEALSPALVADLAPSRQPETETVREARLYGRYQQSLQQQVLGWLAAAGAPCVAIKGFAAAFLYYPTPASRLIGDLDLLVRRDDLPALVDVLAARGFRFGGDDGPAWGFLSDASFRPLHSPDFNCNVDLHVQPDSYPLHLGLDVGQVFDRARQIMAGDLAVAVPCAEHMALIAISNLAKDKFAPSGLRKLLDLGRLLRHEHGFDWQSLAETAARARLTRAMATTVALLRGLGTPDDLLPAGAAAAPSPMLARLLDDWLQMRPPSLLRRLQREWGLAAEPGVAARLLVRRALGVLHRRSGVPDFMRDRPPR